MKGAFVPRIRLLPVMERMGRRELRRRGIPSHIVDTPAARLHVYDAPGEGDLPPAIFLHGIASTATVFGPVMARVRKDVRRVVAPEFPGHGFSDPPRVPLTPEVLALSLEAAIDELVPEPAILIGNSLGGAMALVLAVRRPERVAALVLVSPAGARVDEPGYRELIAAFDARTRKESLAFLDRLYHRRPALAWLLAREFGGVLAKPAVRDILTTARLEDAPSPEQIRALTMPILFVWGKSERLLPATWLAYFRASLPPHAIIEEPEGMGHCPHLDDPRRLAATLRAFLRASLQNQGGTTRTSSAHAPDAP